MAKLRPVPVPLIKKSKPMPILIGRGPRKINGKKLSQIDIDSAKLTFLNRGGIITKLPNQIVLIRSDASLSAKRLGNPHVEAIDWNK